MVDYSNEEIIEGILKQSNKVLSYVYESSFRSIRQLVITNNGNVNDAEDIFQDALILIFDKIRNNNLNLNCAFKTYLYSVCRIIWLKELDRRKRKDETIIGEFTGNEIVDVDNDIIELYIKNERLTLYRSIFNDLTEDCRKVLSMFLNKISIKEITDTMNYSSDQHTKNRRYRCKKSLIEKIKSNPKYNELRYDNNGDDREIPRW